MNEPWHHIKDWLLILAAVAGGLKFLMDWVLKASSASLDAQVKRLELFTSYMNIANAWGEQRFIESALELVVSKELQEWMRKQSVMPANWKIDDPLPTSAVYAQRIFEKHMERCLVRSPIGSAQQHGAIGAVYALGARHSSLRQAAICGLRNLHHLKVWKEIIEPMVKDLEARERSVWYSAKASLSRWFCSGGVWMTSPASGGK